MDSKAVANAGIVDHVADDGSSHTALATAGLHRTILDQTVDNLAVSFQSACDSAGAGAMICAVDADVLHGESRHRSADIAEQSYRAVAIDSSIADGVSATVVVAVEATYRCMAAVQVDVCCLQEVDAGNLKPVIAVLGDGLQVGLAADLEGFLGRAVAGERIEADVVVGVHRPVVIHMAGVFVEHRVSVGLVARQVLEPSGFVGRLVVQQPRDFAAGHPVVRDAGHAVGGVIFTSVSYVFAVSEAIVHIRKNVDIATDATKIL